MANRRNDEKKKTKPVPAKPASPAGSLDSLLRSLDGFEVEEIELTGTAPPRVPQQHKTPPRWWPALRIGGGAIGLGLIAVIAALVTRSA